jgi:hypothetical protein
MKWVDWLIDLCCVLIVVDLGPLVTSEAQTKKSIADIGISEPSAKLIWDVNRFLGLRHFGEICRKPKRHLYEKTSLTLTKLIYPPTIPINIKITPNYREKPTL